MVLSQDSTRPSFVIVSHLGLTEYNVSIGSGVLVYVGFVDNEKDVPGLADGNAADSNNLKETISVKHCISFPSPFTEKTYLFQAQFGHAFSGFLLATALLGLAHQLFWETSSSGNLNILTKLESREKVIHRYFLKTILTWLWPVAWVSSSSGTSSSESESVLSEPSWTMGAPFSNSVTWGILTVLVGS